MCIRLVTAILVALMLAPAGFAQRGPTFTKDIRPILQRNCLECHYEGATLTPMALDTYPRVRPWVKAIRKQLAAGAMPPWHVSDSGRPLEGARGLTPGETEAIMAWLESGTPRGPGAPAKPAPRSSPWRIGEPDLVVDMGVDFSVPAEGVVPYQLFSVALPDIGDRWVSAVEVQPGDSELVHHVSVYVKNPPETGAPYAGPYGTGLLGAYYRGQTESVYPKDAGKFIAQGAALLFQVHYVPTGRAGPDRSRVGLRFHESPPARHVLTRGIANVGFVIPPHVGAYEIRAEHTFESAVEILSMRPLMRARGSRFVIEAKNEHGTETLLDVDRYTFRWNEAYVPTAPIALPAGTTLRCRATMNNAHENVWNPEPHAQVRNGERMSDEIVIGWIDYVRTD